jgi:hypothetical protein
MGQLQQQQQLLTQELTISQILRIYGKRFTQIKNLYSDEFDGRCAMGVIMAYYGWDGSHDSDMTTSLRATYHALKKAGIPDNIIIELNDSGGTFDEIADFLDRYKSWLTQLGRTTAQLVTWFIWDHHGHSGIGYPI